MSKKATTKKKSSTVEKKAIKPAKKVYEKKSIKYEYSDKQLADKSQELASAVQDMNNIESDKKSVMSDYKSKIDAKVAEIQGLSNSVKSGFDNRIVECEVRKNFKTYKREYWYEGVKRMEETLTQKDVQLEIPVEEKEPVLVKGGKPDTDTKEKVVVDPTAKPHSQSEDLSAAEAFNETTAKAVVAKSKEEKKKVSYPLRNTKQRK